MRLALDAGSVRAVIDAALLVPGHELATLALDHVRCPSADEAVAGWRVTTRGAHGCRESWVTARVAPGWRVMRERERLAAREQPAFGGLCGVTSDPDDSVLFVACPIDRVLRELHRVLRRTRGELVAYRPEQRAVLRTDSAWVQVRAVPLAEAEYHATVLAAQVGLGSTIPHAAIGDRVVHEAPLRGEPFRGEPGAARALGSALAQWHGLAEDPRHADASLRLPRESALDELDASLRACHALAVLDPGLGERAFAIAERLAGLVPARSRVVLRHGALTCARIRVLDGKVAVRGFLRSSRGPASRDLATLRVDLALSGIDPIRGSEAVLDGYGSSPTSAELRWFEANAALQSTCAAFERARVDWPQRATQVLQLAADAASAIAS